MAADPTIAEAQREMREVYRATFPGSLVSAALWFGSAAVATWVSESVSIWTLFFGGMFIFPVTLLVLKALGGPVAVKRENTLPQLAMQVAFIVPLLFPLVWLASAHHRPFYFPAMAFVVGVHYLPFTFLYGMRQFLALAAALVAAAVCAAHAPSGGFALCAWITGAILLAFGLWIRLTVPEAAGRRAAT